MADWAAKSGRLASSCGRATLKKMLAAHRFGPLPHSIELWPRKLQFHFNVRVAELHSGCYDPVGGQRFIHLSRTQWLSSGKLPISPLTRPSNERLTSWCVLFPCDSFTTLPG